VHLSLSSALSLFWPVSVTLCNPRRRATTSSEAWPNRRGRGGKGRDWELKNERVKGKRNLRKGRGSEEELKKGKRKLRKERGKGRGT
jgi:hypothetical protein